jgi:hypothetical protein
MRPDVRGFARSGQTPGRNSSRGAMALGGSSLPPPPPRRTRGPLAAAATIAASASSSTAALRSRFAPGRSSPPPPPPALRAAAAVTSAAGAVAALADSSMAADGSAVPSSAGATGGGPSRGAHSTYVSGTKRRHTSATSANAAVTMLGARNGNWSRRPVPCGAPSCTRACAQPPPKWRSGSAQLGEAHASGLPAGAERPHSDRAHKCSRTDEIRCDRMPPRAGPMINPTLNVVVTTAMPLCARPRARSMHAAC